MEKKPGCLKNEEEEIDTKVSTEKKARRGAS